MTVVFSVVPSDGGGASAGFGPTPITSCRADRKTGHMPNSFAAISFSSGISHEDGAPASA
jgi:hypothetical protein